MILASAILEEKLYPNSYNINPKRRLER